jgi:nitrite reductase/ring-hydroxylating ferredoxin subunit
VRSRRSIRKVDRKKKERLGRPGGHNAPSGREEAGELSDDVDAGVEDSGWIAVLPVTDLADRKPVKVDVDGSAVLLVRNGEELFGIGNRCTHQGAPLHKGVVRFGGSLRTVQCPLHGSMFDLAEGRVLRGPATEPAPVYDTRVTDGVVEIRPR